MELIVNKVVTLVKITRVALVCKKFFTNSLLPWAQFWAHLVEAGFTIQIHAFRGTLSVILKWQVDQDFLGSHVNECISFRKAYDADASPFP